MLTKAQYFGIYLGQKVTNTYTKELTGILYKVSNTLISIYGDNQGVSEKGTNMPIENCKLILRPYGDMTEDENKAYNQIKFVGHTSNPFNFTYQLQHLISIGIDVFDCHSKGWVVYESELQKGD